MNAFTINTPEYAALSEHWARLCNHIEEQGIFEDAPTVVLSGADQAEQEALLRLMLGVRPGQVSQEANQIVDELMGRNNNQMGAQLFGPVGHAAHPVHAQQSAATSKAPQMHQAAVPPTAEQADETDETPERRMKGEFLRGRPACHVRMPGGRVDVGMVELNTFFPACFLNPEAILRANRNGFSREQLAEMQLRPVNQFHKTEFTTTVNRLQQQISKAGKLEEPNRQGRWRTEEYVKRVGLQSDLTTAAWRQREQYGNGGSTGRWTDMSLVDIANCVPRANWPVGNDRLYVTACLEFAVANPGRNLTTANWASIIQNDLPTFALPAALTGANENRDTEAHTRLFG
ncbi:hypothetical protein LTR56_023317 [Elasticomyces elasticus]|nr:hypothetical protein LTR56_023317 [Elasticomyces elasticus]KAK3629844.1 hypothetical protein LTR22_021737 [Elasticomyces elasticus]KAK4908833.1 hypothetical protein LTR49_022337 [Elasticomyces elasticus]KAK5743908.1 hypothetical protein LTS12_023672 [Elasticomyces elasticus]